MQKISPFLCFKDQAEEAVNFYVATFKKSRIVNQHRAGPPGPGSKLVSAVFELEGVRFMALNAGPGFTFTPAMSLFVSCDTQAELDELWAKLSEGGAGQRCGWLRDRFGISWQLIPSALGTLLSSKDPASTQRVLKAMQPMTKIDIAALERAARGGAL